MKKIIVLLFATILIGGAASAQVKKTETKTETKSKPTTTVPQKVHNVIHPHHKKYSGHKTKHKTEVKKD